MQVDNYTQSQLYTGNGVTTQFDFSFSFGDESEIKLVVAGEEVDSSQYSIQSLNYQSGGTVICLTAPAFGESIRIYRQTAFTQESSFSNFNQVDLKKMENTFDKGIRIAQELRNSIDTSSVADIQAQIDNTNIILAEVGAESTQNTADIEDLQIDKEDKANKGIAEGYCELDVNAKVPLDRMPIAALKYMGTWDATTNTPTLTDNDTAKAGNVYIVSAAGTQFSIDWQISDWLIYNDSGVIQKIDNTDLVISVNGMTGAVSGLEETTNKTDDITANTGSSTKYPSVKGVEDYVDGIVISGISVGDIKYNSKSATFTGWLACDGSAVSRTSYADLFNNIGTLYGAGDGSTTFNLPDFRGQFLRGRDDGTLTAAVGTKQLSAAPNIIATATGGADSSSPYDGAFVSATGSFTITKGGGSYYMDTGNGGRQCILTLNASLSNAAYGRDSTTEVRPTNFAVYMYIKY